MSERIQKVLARAGFGSRRELEAKIRAGRVSVNGVVASLGARVGPDDVVRIDGERVRLSKLPPPRRRVLLYYKPEGEVTSRGDPAGRPTVFEALPRPAHGRWVAVGRLDVNTTGLLLFTTDGELAHRLMHPSAGIEREYAIRVRGTIAEDSRQRLLAGVELADGMARFESLEPAGGEGENHWYKGVLKEGRNREVRRLMDSQGLIVSRLIRVRFGSVVLPRDLGRGRWRELSPVQVDAVAGAVGLGPDARRRPRSKAARGRGPRGRRRRRG
jgi:23S rRNA pseudouridine2605 synthase